MTQFDSGDLKQSPTTIEAQADDLAIVDTGSGCLIFEETRETLSYTGREIVLSRELVGFYDVQDWGAIREALVNRGLGVGAISNLPEFDHLGEVGQ